MKARGRRVAGGDGVEWRGSASEWERWQARKHASARHTVVGVVEKRHEIGDVCQLLRSLALSEDRKAAVIPAHQLLSGQALSHARALVWRRHLPRLAAAYQLAGWQWRSHVALGLSIYHECFRSDAPLRSAHVQPIVRLSHEVT